MCRAVDLIHNSTPKQWKSTGTTCEGKYVSNTNVLWLSRCHLNKGSSDNHREEEVPQEEAGMMSWGSEVEVLGKKGLELR